MWGSLVPSKLHQRCPRLSKFILGYMPPTKSLLSVSKETFIRMLMAILFIMTKKILNFIAKKTNKDDTFIKKKKIIWSK